MSSAQNLTKSIIDTNHSSDAVYAYFKWCTRNLEGIGGGPPAGLAFIQFEDLVEEGTDRPEAFAVAYAFLKGICPIEIE